MPWSSISCPLRQSTSCKTKYSFLSQPFSAGRASPGHQGANYQDSSSDRPRLRLGYRSLSSSSMKGGSPSRDESKSPEQPRLPEHPTDHPAKRKTSSPGHAQHGHSSQRSANSFERENSAEYELLSSSESLDGPRSALHRNHREPAAHGSEDAPSVSSGYNSDDLNNSSHEATSPGPAASPQPAKSASAQQYDPKQYQDRQNEFHAVSLHIGSFTF